MAQSQGPVPRPLKGAGSQQEHPGSRNKYTDYQQRGTEDAPFIIKTPSPKTKAEADYETYNRFKKPTYEKAAVWITGFIALITAILAIFNILLWRATRKAAEAARASAEALPTIERAYLFVEPELTHDQGALFPDEGLKMIIKIYNGGKTPAVEMRAYADIIEAIECPVSIDESKNIKLLKGDIIKADTTHAEPIDHWNIPDIGAISRSDNRSFICYGRVDYKDMFEQSHFTKFCWHYSFRHLVEEDSIFYRCENKEANRRT